jgi:hypothetical protein
MQSHEPKDDLNVLEKMGYETRDFAAEKTAKALGWGAFFTIIVFVVSWFMIGFVQAITGAEAKVDANKPLAGFRRMPENPHPLLQSNRTAWKDMIDVKQKEKEALNTYGDADGGKARIPIDKAIAKTAGTLPVRANAAEENPQ